MLFLEKPRQIISPVKHHLLLYAIAAQNDVRESGFDTGHVGQVLHLDFATNFLYLSCLKEVLPSGCVKQFLYLESVTESRMCT